MTGATSGSVRHVLRLEGFCLLVASLLLYQRFGAGWGLFAAVFFLPDLAFAGYLAGPRVGAGVYNAAHSYAGAVGALVAALLLPALVSPALGLVWCAHIGFDRALGYGLKYPQGFGFTHLGLIGRGAREMERAPSERAGSQRELRGRAGVR